MFIPIRRSALLIPVARSDPSSSFHLFIQLTGPLGKNREVLLVSISTLREGLPFDDACILEAGDHEFIRHRSYVRYDMPVFLSVEKLKKGVRDGTLKTKPMVSEAVYEKIRRGLRSSMQVSPKMRRFFEEDQAAI